MIKAPKNSFEMLLSEFSIKRLGLLSLALICHFLGNIVFADSGPLAILGGQREVPYAAFLDSDGSAVTLKGLPPNGLTYRVAINSSGRGIIGGTSGLNAYAALVSPKGVLNSLAGLMAPGEIYTVAINNAGNGIIGGGYLKANVPYAALVSKHGLVTSLPLLSSGLIYSVALDISGEGIIGGIGPLNSAYAGLISSSGTVSSLTNLPSTGAIFWVATNDSKTRFIGGQDNASVYAAFVDPKGSLQSVVGLPLGLNYSVALNATGNAIMGGTSLTRPYAALVARSGSVRTLTGLPSTAGKIYNVAINDSGTGLIAGFSTAGPYGSFVGPDGSLTPLKGLPTGDGFLDGAALHSSGIGIVGGTSSNSPFAALAAPNGTLTYLKGLPSTGEINSISIATLDNLVPKSIGPFDSWANTQFALSDALTQHCIFQKIGGQKICSTPPSLNFKTTKGSFSLWLSAIGNYVHEKRRHMLPTFSNKICGLLLGLDYMGIQDLVIGGGLAYSYNSVRYFHKEGHASINQESAVLYVNWNLAHFYMNAALWGGIFQTTHKRRSLTFISSKAKPTGWNLSPHLDLNLPFQTVLPYEFVIDPFIAFDWVNNWQYHFRERGFSGFNIKLNNQYASIFRSELGCRLFETFHFPCVDFIVEEKISYVNRTPLCKGKSKAFFIGAASTFDVRTMDTTSQSLGSVQIHVECIPSGLKNMYASLDYQGGFGSSFQSHLLTCTMGKNF